MQGENIGVYMLGKINMKFMWIIFKTLKKYLLLAESKYRSCQLPILFWNQGNGGELNHMAPVDFSC